MFTEHALQHVNKKSIKPVESESDKQIGYDFKWYNTIVFSYIVCTKCWLFLIHYKQII